MPDIKPPYNSIVPFFIHLTFFHQNYQLLIGLKVSFEILFRNVVIELRTVLMIFNNSLSNLIELKLSLFYLYNIGCYVSGQRLRFQEMPIPKLMKF